MNTNIPGKNGTMKITIQGVVWQPIEAKPRLAAFNRISAEAAREGTLVRKLTIVNNVDEAATLTNVRSSSPMFKAEVTELEPGKKFELIVSLVPPFQSGNNSGHIELSTGLKEMPELKVQARVYITADVDVMPPKLVLRGDRKVPMKRQLSVKNHTNKQMVVSNIKASDPRIKATLQESIAGKQYKISVEIPVEYSAPKSGDKITFNTNIPTMPTVEIPVTQNKKKRARKGTPRRANSPTNTRSIPRSDRMRPSPRKVGAGSTPAARKAPAAGKGPDLPNSSNPDRVSNEKEKSAAAQGAKAHEKAANNKAKPTLGDQKTGDEK